MEGEVNLLGTKNRWEEDLRRIILTKQDDLLDFLLSTKSGNVLSYLGDDREGVYQRVQKIVDEYIRENILTPQDVLDIVRENQIHLRTTENKNFLRRAAIVCKKTGIAIKDIFGVAMDMRLNSHNLGGDDLEIFFNEESLNLLSEGLGEENMKKALNSGGSYEILHYKQHTGEVFQRMKVLFFLFDYKCESKGISIRPSSVLQEFIKIYGQKEAMKDIFLLSSFFYNILGDALKHNISFDVKSIKDLCSLENVFQWIGEKNTVSQKGEIEEFVNIIDKLNKKKIIEIDMYDYKTRYQGLSKEMNIKDVDMMTIIEKYHHQEHSFWEGVLLSIVGNRIDLILQHSSIEIQIPDDIKTNKTDNFFEKKQQLLKELYVFGHKELMNGTNKEIKVLSLLKQELPRSLGQTIAYIDFLQTILHHKESKENRSEELSVIWFQVYNRPFELQRNFYSISLLLIRKSAKVYETFLKKFLLLSKKNRKNFIENVAPVIEIPIMFLDELEVCEGDEQEKINGNSHQKGKNTIHLIESVFDKISSGMTIEQLKQEVASGENINEYKKVFLEEELYIQNTEEYMHNFPETTEIFFTYARNISQKTKKNLRTIGYMLASTKTQTRNELRVNKKYPQKELSSQGQAAANEILDFKERLYWSEHIDSQTLLALQEDTQHIIEILPQTIGERLFNIQQSFEELYDPDIYEQEEIKSLAKELFQHSNKQSIWKNHKQLLKEDEILNRENYLPIITFAQEIDDLHIEERLHELKIYQERGESLPEEIAEMCKKCITDAIVIFEKIVVNYKKSGVADTAQIRIEEIANNFSLEVDELTRGVSPSLEIEDPIQIKSIMTTNMIEIIKNIRGCLGCMKKNGSNHVNLEFLSPNRFIIFSGQKEDEQSNIADQLCILSQTDQGLCFILDTLYGARMSKIFVNHCMTVIQKVQSTKDVLIKIFIPQASIKSAGTNISHFQSLLHAECIKENIDITLQQTQITPNTDYLGYQEFGIKEGNIQGILICVQ